MHTRCAGGGCESTVRTIHTRWAAVALAELAAEHEANPVALGASSKRSTNANASPVEHEAALAGVGVGNR